MQGAVRPPFFGMMPTNKYVKSFNYEMHTGSFTTKYIVLTPFLSFFLRRSLDDGRLF